MTEKDRELILEFKKKLYPEIKNHVKEIIVFGSRVNGFLSEDSDLDVIALVDEKTQELESGLEDIIYEIMWINDFKPIISLKVFSESNFNERAQKGFSFYKTVKKEGQTV